MSITSEEDKKDTVYQVDQPETKSGHADSIPFFDECALSVVN